MHISFARTVGKLFGVLLFSLCLLAHSAFARIDTFKFSNGAELISKCAEGLYYRSPQGKLMLVKEGTVYSFPNDEGTNETFECKHSSRSTALWLFRLNSDIPHSGVIEVDGNFLIVYPDGTAVTLSKKLPKEAYKNTEYSLSGHSVAGPFFYSFDQIREPKHPELFVFGVALKGPQDVAETFLIGPHKTYISLKKHVPISRRDFFNPKEFQFLSETQLKVKTTGEIVDLSPLLTSQGIRPKTILLTPPIPQVKNDEGVEVSAREIVSSLFPNMLLKKHERDELIFEFPREETQLIASALEKKKPSSIAVLGPPGGEMMDYVRSFIAQVRRGEIHSVHPDTEFLLVNPNSLEAGTRYTGTFSSRLNALIQYARGRSAYLVIPDLESLQGSGTHIGNKNDFFSRMRESILDGTVKILATAVKDEFYLGFSDDPGLLKAFATLNTPDPSDDKILERIRAYTQRRYGFSFSDAFFQGLIRKADDYDAIGSLMSRTVRLTDEVIHQMRKMNTDFVTPQLVWQACAELYQLPPQYFDPALRKVHIETYLQTVSERIAGMPQLKDLLYRSFLHTLTRATPSDRPQARILFAGPKGVGKTEITQAHALAMGLPFKEINMNDYPTPHSVDAFRRAVYEALLMNPFTVLFFDEFEKAHKQVQNALLKMLESRWLSFDLPETSQSGGATRVSIRVSSATVIAATNAGQEYIKTVPPDQFNLDDFRRNIEKEGILSEFAMDRFQHLAAVYPAQNKEEYGAILEKNLSRWLKAKSEEENTVLKIDLQEAKAFVSELAARHFKTGASYRPGVSELSTQLADSYCSLVLSKEGIPHPATLRLIESRPEEK